ncbi:hypothetical protein [Cypionkella psychrotolerans]|uniref:hypothetical protein n=1 Tax=Cypionkella psychrotolerans TaxID=1678131 RepID=UPI0006B50682|nr:hypothetical protein [Cypionkella psychrotolerans]
MKWLWGAIISIVAAGLASDNELVVTTSLYSLGLMLPVWLLAANLWWILALILCWQAANSARGAKFASGIVLGGILALGAGFYALRAGQIAQLPPAEHVTLAQLTIKPQSLDYILQTSGSYSPYETCDALCLAALRGGEIRWIRLVRFQTQMMAHMVFPVAGKTCADLNLPAMQPKGCLAPATLSRFSAIIESRDRAACLAQQPDFPADQPCLTFTADDGRKADLALTITEANAAELLAASGDLVRLTGLTHLTLQDIRGSAPVDLARHTMRSYSQVSAPLPMVPVMSLQSSKGGFNVPHGQLREALPDLPTVLADAGIAVRPSAGFVSGIVDPHVIKPPAPVQHALALTRGADPAAVWLRLDPPKPPPVPPIKRRSAAEIAAAKQARRARDDKMITDAIRSTLPPIAP